jgi:RHS repeat-associated protein
MKSVVVLLILALIVGAGWPLCPPRSSATSFYEADGLGSVTSLTSAAGALAQTYTFDSFGKQTASSGSLTNPFQYTGREFDPETSLYYYRARYYDPSTRRFLSEDPADFEGEQISTGMFLTIRSGIAIRQV